MQLYSYFRSAASFRVRIGLALKGLPFDHRPVHLLTNEHLGEAFREINPQQSVPVLEDGDVRLHQSLAILEYLDETHPEPPLLPPDPLGRARVRALAHDIATEIHPLTNLRVLRFLVQQMGASEDVKNHWYHHWVEQGLQALEVRLEREPETGMFCHGYGPTLADCVLVPQIFNAQRFECRLDAYPRTMRIFEACMSLPAFQAARPEACPDAE